MKTIKIIDLLNKIANGEQPPIQIEYKSTRFKLNYIGYKQASYLNNGKCLLEGWNTTMCLTDEVEILDEEDEFEDIEEIEHQYIYGLTANEEKIDDRVSRFEDKINALIKNQKKIIDKLNKE